MPRYQYLARGFPVFPLRRASLWLGEDHLLHVRHGAFEDRYHRFYFKDIQRIAVYRTARAMLQSGILMLLTIAALLAAFSAAGIGFRIFWSLIVGLLLWWLVFSAIGGHSCVCTLQTATGEKRLMAPERLREATRILRRVHPLINAAQAPLASRDAAD